MPVFQFGFQIERTQSTDLVVRVEAATEEEARKLAKSGAEKAVRNAVESDDLIDDSLSDWEYSDLCLLGESNDDEYDRKSQNGEFMYGADLNLVTKHLAVPSTVKGADPMFTYCHKMVLKTLTVEKPEDSTCKVCLEREKTKENMP